MLVCKLMENWGETGWNDHVDKVALFYMRRRDVFMRYAQRYLPILTDWVPPTSGMFVWFHLHGVMDTKSLIEEKAIEAKVILVPGAAFSPEEGAKSSFVRASYSSASDADIKEALKRMAKLLRRHHRAWPEKSF